MNEFNKEELQDIYDAVMDTEIPILGYLPSKIQSMIDNYCEHVYVMRACDCAIYCPLCGVIR